MLLQKKMIDKEISNLKAIDTLIRQEQPLAVYRIPGEDTPRLLTQASGSVRLLYDLKDLDRARGFVIAPSTRKRSWKLSGCVKAGKHFQKLARKSTKHASGHL